jgi:MFS family permease
VINSVADSLSLIYVAAVIAGLGAAPIFAATAGNAVKWFPDRRGLATGLTVAGFGAGSALTVVPLANLIRTSGYEQAFLWFGLGQGIVIVLAALMLRTPQAESPLVNVDRNVEIEDLASRMDLSASRRVVSGLEDTLEKMDRNVNSRMLAEVLLLDLPKV